MKTKQSLCVILLGLFVWNTCRFAQAAPAAARTGNGDLLPQAEENVDAPSWRFTDLFRTGYNWLANNYDRAQAELNRRPNAITGVSTWTGGAGNWSDGSMWSPTGSPNDATADVFIDGGQTATASAVSLAGGYTVGRITIDSGDSLTINDNSQLIVTNSSGLGSIVNNGNIVVTTSGNFSQLSIAGAVSLTGSGAITLTRDASVTSSSNALLRGGGTVSNSSTIQGEGYVGVNETGIINQSSGVIQANVSGRVLLVDPNSSVGLTNSGTMRATGGGVMQLTGNGGGDFINTGGSIQANGASSEVQLINSARVSGGTLSTSGGGIIRTTNSQTAFLDGLTNSGSFLGNDNSTTIISGTITNAGDFTFSTDGNFTNLRIDTAATLTGAGTVTLTRNAVATGSSNARIAGSGTLTNQSTIQGEGYVGSNETTIVNQSSGIIQANVSGRNLQLDPASGTGTFANQGLLRASNGGVLQLTGNGGGTFNNTGGIIRAEAGSEVQLFNSVTISGGTLATQGAGALLRTLNSNTVTLDNLTLAGTYTASDNSTTILAGAINNTGDLTVTTDGNLTNLRVTGAAILQSGGTVTLTRNAVVTSSSNARIDGTGTLTNASTIQGEGTVASNETTIVNQSGGIIQANVAGRTLTFDAANQAGAFSNAGTLRATNGGFLQFTGNAGGDFTNTATGSIQASGMGSEVQLVNQAIIHGGTLSTSGGGIIRTVNSQTATLDTLTNAGNFIGNDNSTTFFTGTITNNGDITVTTDGNFTDLRIGSPVTLNGTGTVTLTRNASATGSSNARISGSGTLTNNSTIQGEGYVGANELSIVNSATGIVQANVAGRPLVIDPSSAAGSYSNSGIFRATNGGILQLSGNGGGDFNNTGTGTIQAIGAGSEVQLVNTAVLHGGTLISSGGGLFRNPNSNTATLDGVTNPGNFIGNDNSTTLLQNTIDNTGDMTFTTDGNFTDVRIDGATTLTGSGTITLTRNAAVTGSSNSRIRGSGTLTNGTTIQGEGYVGANETTLINANGGVIQANVSGRTLTIDPANNATGLTNNSGGTLRASNGGTLNLTGNSGGAFANNGAFEALDGSSLFMDSSASLTNNVAGVLTGGRYRAIADGNGATLTIRGGAVTTLSGAEVVLSGVGSVFQNDTTAIESSLTTNAGILRVLGNRNYTNVNALSSSGTIELGGGVFDAPGLTSSGEIFGFGTITPRPTNSGLIRAIGGSLSLTNGVGSTGTVQSDATGILNLSNSGTASSSNILANNGNLALGAQNFVVNLDYTNSNFGVGNTFNPRANVSGAGLINAAGNVGQSLTGVSSGGTGTTPVLAFGNIHVGDTTTRNYQVNNTGTSGPSIRGALQTSVNGGNISDGRLTGSGVTASNFGPIGLGANSGNLAVTFSGTAAGALSGQILHVVNNFDNVQEQNLSITGAAYRYANPTAHSPEPVNFGNFHVGDTAPSQLLSLTNSLPNDGFSEALNASIGGATGGVTTNGGSFALLAPGGTNNSALRVGISTASAGNQNGTATITLQSDGTGSSGLPTTNLQSQTVNVTGSVYRLAAPGTHTPEPVSFGVVHIGDTPSQAISLSNTAVNDGFSEKLNGSISPATGGVTASGSFSLLAPGSSSSALSVGINTSSVGNKNGTATIGLVSNGTGTSGLANSSLMSQTVNVTGQVNYFADPLLVFKMGSATLTQNSPTSFTLNFGQVAQNSGTYMASFGVQNFLHDATFQDSLGGSYNTASVTNFILSGFNSFSGIAPGSSSDPTVGFNSSMAIGSYSNSLSLNPTSSNASGTSNLSSVQLNVVGQIIVVPEPSTWMMLTIGGAGVLSARRFVRRRG